MSWVKWFLSLEGNNIFSEVSKSYLGMFSIEIINV